jgi:hypothetical protein
MVAPAVVAPAVVASGYVAIVVDKIVSSDRKMFIPLATGVWKDVARRRNVGTILSVLWTHFASKETASMLDW